MKRQIIFFLLSFMITLPSLAQESESAFSTDISGVYIQAFFEGGFSAVSSVDNASSIRGQIALGMGIKGHSFVGLVGGFRASQYVLTYPVFLDYRYSPCDRKVALHAAAGGGLSLGSRDDFVVNGPAMHAEVGVRINTPTRFGVLFFVGYENFHSKILEVVRSGLVYGSSRNSEPQSLHCFTLGVGISLL